MDHTPDLTSDSSLAPDIATANTLTKAPAIHELKTDILTLPKEAKDPVDLSQTTSLPATPISLSHDLASSLTLTSEKVKPRVGATRPPPANR